MGSPGSAVLRIGLFNRCLCRALQCVPEMDFRNCHTVVIYRACIAFQFVLTLNMSGMNLRKSQTICANGDMACFLMLLRMCAFMMLFCVLHLKIHPSVICSGGASALFPIISC